MILRLFHRFAPNEEKEISSMRLPEIGEIVKPRK
jgi:hypothetical protein